MKALFSPFNLIALLLLALAYGGYALVTRPAPLPDIQGLDDGGARQSQTVQLFFSNSQLSDFALERRTLSLREAERLNLPQVALDALMDGPKGGRVRLVPRDAERPTVFLRSGHFFVDLPASWRTLSLSGSGELMVLCAITRTLLALGDHQDVNFSVGGQGSETLLGHVDLTAPFDAQTCSL